jgi:restriction endonuclease S subunit
MNGYSAKVVKLSSVCEVQTGYTARSKLEPTTGGGIPAIQLRDLRGEEAFDPDGLPSYPLGPSFERYWAGAGDVLFRSRGERNTAVLIAPHTKSAAVAVLPLMVLRPKHEIIDSAYLAWFINQSESQRYFDKYASPSTLRMISKQCIDDLAVALPDLETQRLVVQVAQLARQEHDLAQRLIDKRQQLTEFALLRQVRNAQLHGNGAGRITARRQAGTSERTD